MTIYLTRTAPMQIDPVPMHVGDGVQFAEGKRWWRVRAVSERYVILTAPNNLPSYPCHRHDGREHCHVDYTIIDWRRGVRGPDDHYSVGYETQEDIDQALARLHGPIQLDGYEVPQIEVSHRAHTIRARVAVVRHKKSCPVEGAA